MKFYLGTHMPQHLERTDAPLFVSHRRLKDRRTFPRALAGWALDSGGFTELTMYGAWQTTPGEYARAVRRYADEVGRLEWCAPQDYMCEPFMIAKTGLTIREHQRRTVENYLDLEARGLPVIPVLQGWQLADYLRHVEDYAAAGVDLRLAQRVGLGSVCRRQATDEIAAISWTLREQGLSLHGFGVKTRGLETYAEALTSSDSLAWSYAARREEPLPGCTHPRCNNCLAFALAWRERVLAKLSGQMSLLT